MVRKEDGKYYVYSKEGKRLSKGYSSKKEAEDRLKEIEYFKHNKVTKSMKESKVLTAIKALLDLAVGDSDNEDIHPEGDITPEGVTVRKAVDEMERRALFVVMEPQNDDGTTNDLHGDWFSAEDVVEACRSFNVHCMKANLMHSIMVDVDVAVIEQSYTSPVAFDIERTDGTIQHIKKDTWLQEWHFPKPEGSDEDTVWQGVLDGEFVGLSPFCDALGYELDDK